MEEEPLEGSKRLPIIDTRKQYFRYIHCFSLQQAARPPKPKSSNQQIPFQQWNIKIPAGAIYKTT